MSARIDDSIAQEQDKIDTFTIKYFSMPLSYVIYGSVGLVVITILLYLFSKKKNR